MMKNYYFSDDGHLKVDNPLVKQLEVIKNSLILLTVMRDRTRIFANKLKVFFKIPKA
jgi:hypothetical protein